MCVGARHTFMGAVFTVPLTEIDYHRKTNFIMRLWADYNIGVFQVREII
jgi:hypothetical protein